MKYLDNNGLRTILTKMKALFVTKSELDTKLKSVGGGTEGVAHCKCGNLYFELIKSGKKVDVYQLKYAPSSYSETLPREFRVDEIDDYNNDSYAIGIVFDSSIKRLNISGSKLYLEEMDFNYINSSGKSVSVDMKWANWYDRSYIGQYRLD